jgi:PII-like signaling protein
MEEAKVLSRGPAKKVTIYVNEDTQHHLGALYDSILTFLMHKGVAGATATRALAGFGAHQTLHTPKIEVLAEHLPIRIEFVESAERVDELLPTLYDMVTDGLIEVQDTTVVKVARKDRKPPPAGPHEEKRQRAKLMRVFMGEADRWRGEPLHDAIIKRLRMMDVAGATVYRGIDGYGAKGHAHKHGFLHISHDLPVMISVIDTPEKIADAVSAVEEMLEEGLIAVSDVEMIRLVRSHSSIRSGDASIKSS